MGLFNENQVKRLKEMGIKAEINRGYSDEEKNKMRTEMFDFIFSQSTKNNDIRNLQIKNADIINIL